MKLSRKDARDIPGKVRGSDLTPKMTLLKARSRIGAMADSDMREMLSSPPCNQTQIRPPEGHETQHLEGPMFMDTRDEVVQKWCVPTPRQMGTDGRGNMADGLSEGHRDTTDEDQIDGCRHSVFGVITYTLRLHARANIKRQKCSGQV